MMSETVLSSNGYGIEVGSIEESTSQCQAIGGHNYSIDSEEGRNTLLLRENLGLPEL